MIQTVLPTTEATTPRWRGINHLALITTDMDATVRFYHGTLGARLVATIATPELRHYFFEFGPQCTVAFFRIRRHHDRTIHEGGRRARPTRRPVDHLALNLPDEARSTISNTA
jgi:catechol 2,3-dioxygenase-like lactoylglutathione lyase family enzyme